jgi:CBS domain-containing protein
VTGTIAEALASMVQHPFNSFPLLDEKGAILGIVSQSQMYDVLKDGDLTPESTMDKLRPTAIPTVHADLAVTDALETLMRSGCNKCLVVDTDGKLQGVLTPADLMARGASSA